MLAYALKAMNFKIGAEIKPADCIKLGQVLERLHFDFTAELQQDSMVSGSGSANFFDAPIHKQLTYDQN